MKRWARWTLLLLALTLLLPGPTRAEEEITAQDAALTITEKKKMHILAAGESMQLTASFKDPRKVNAQAGNSRILWQVETDQHKPVNAEWVKITSQGKLITSKKVNRAYNVIVSATSAVFGTQARYRVLVYPPVKDYSISRTTLTVYADSKPVTLRAYTKPAGLARTIAWRSGNTGIATLKRNADGSIQVQPHKAGDTSIVTYSKTGIKRRVTVHVRKPVQKIRIIGEDVVRQNESIFLRASITPRDAFNKEVEWSLDVDAAVANIDQRGRLHVTMNSNVGDTITVSCRAKGTGRKLVATKEILIIYAWNNFD